MRPTGFGVAPRICVRHNCRVPEVRFTRSARKHRVAASRARYVLAHPYVIVPVPPKEGVRDEMLMHLGDDHTGRALEVGVFPVDGVVLVAHVMDLRAKFRPLYEQGKAFQAREEQR